MKKFSLLVCAMLVLILTSGCGKEETLTLKDNLDVEINSEVKLSSLVKEDSKLELINGEQLVDTSS